MTALPRNTIVVGDAVAELRKLPEGAIDCVVTSPPYYCLRDYGMAGQLGLEPDVESWVANLRAVLTEVGRVLTPTGSLWLNLGDSFSRHARYGAASKSLLLAPERLLLALSVDGWLVRGKVIWAKSNPMPTSVRDRLAMTYEVVYHLTRSPRYFFDLDAIREPHRTSARRPAKVASEQAAWRGPLAGKHDGLDRARPDGVPGHPLGKNPGDVWRIATRGHGDHHAAFPGELVRRPILATCPAAVCTACGQVWERERSRVRLGSLVPCGCGAATRPGMVLDPFMGTGTVAVVARELGRDCLGIELSPAFAAIARKRLGLETTGYRRSSSLTVTNLRYHQTSLRTWLPDGGRNGGKGSLVVDTHRSRLRAGGDHRQAPDGCWHPVTVTPWTRRSGGGGSSRDHLSGHRAVVTSAEEEDLRDHPTTFKPESRRGSDKQSPGRYHEVRRTEVAG